MNNVLITKTGKVIDCSGGIHTEVCKRELKITMYRFLTKLGGVRIKVCWPDNETIAIEYYFKLTEKQIRAIKKILRESNYYAVILGFGLITKFRPIRNFDFDGVMVHK